MNDLPLDMKETALTLLNETFYSYRKRLWETVTKNPDLMQTFPAFLIVPEKVRIYFGKRHIAIEYVGPEHRAVEEYKQEQQLELEYHDCLSSAFLMDDILGFEYDGTSDERIPLAGFLEGLFVPSNRAEGILRDNRWNYGAEEHLLILNSGGFDFPDDTGTRLVHCFFFGADDVGVIPRYIMWMEVFPVQTTECDEHYSILLPRFDNLERLGVSDAYFRFPRPDERHWQKLSILNRFVELFCSSNVSETEITRFLSKPENQFILKMAFFSKEIHPELQCEWAEGQRPSVRPDFFVVSPNLFADIVEFKLPTLKTSAVVGRQNREAFSAAISSYIAQTRVYFEYFDDPRNREYVERTHGIKVFHPKRWLVIGRRADFPPEVRQAIQADYANLAIRTYDEIVDGVLSQLYE